MTQALTMDEAAQALHVKARWLRYWIAAHPVDALGKPLLCSDGTEQDIRAGDILRIRACIREEERCRLSSIGVTGHLELPGNVGPAGRRQRISGSCKTENKGHRGAVRLRNRKAILGRSFRWSVSSPDVRRAAAAVPRPASRSLPAAGRGVFQGTFVKDINSGTIRQMAIELFGHCSGSSRNRLAITPTQSVINHAAESGLCRRSGSSAFRSRRRRRNPRRCRG
jgi:hypothetical protein